MSALNTPDLVVTAGDDHVTTIELNRPPENYLDEDLVRQIADVLESVEHDLDVRAVVLVSAGKHFCAGAKLSPNADDLPTGDTNPLYDQVVRLFAGTVPIVAAVQGAAVGAGLGLALAADFRVAAPEARFAATFAKLGFHQGFGLSTTLPRAVGSQLALEMLYTGRRISGDDSVRLGLCDRLVPAAELRSAAHALALEIAESAPLAVRAIRRTMRGSLFAEVGAATRLEHSEQQPLRLTADYREGVQATAERRPPVFTGR
ncbi:MAG: enoyl-CoA hydratase/isomerase family protein [Acidimicrobiia bacterium]